MDDLENRSDGNIFIIYGLDEPNAENTEEFERKVKREIYLRKLGITVTEIKRCHRLGREVKIKISPHYIKVRRLMREGNYIKIN